MRIDRVLYAAEDPDATAQRIAAELGLMPGPAGTQPGAGIAGRIVPLGGVTLEVLGVSDPRTASTSALGQALQAQLTAEGEGPWAWAVAVDDLDPVAERLGLEVAELDGVEVAGLAEALADPSRPYFVAGEETGDGTRVTDGDPQGVTWIEVGGDQAGLDELLGGAPLPVRFAPDADGVVALGVGERELRRTGPA